MYQENDQNKDLITQQGQKGKNILRVNRKLQLYLPALFVEMGVWGVDLFPLAFDLMLTLPPFTGV